MKVYTAGCAGAVERERGWATAYKNRLVSFHYINEPGKNDYKVFSWFKSWIRGGI